jgi:hypothetical protein
MNNNTSGENFHSKLLKILAIVIAALFLWKYLFIFAANFFIFLDRLLSFGANGSPFPGWLVIGLFIGTIYGAWTSLRKYKVEKRLFFVSLSCTALFLLILFLGNHPFHNL